MLQVRKRKDSPYFQIKGTIQLPNGTFRVRQSSGTADIKEAELIALKIHKEVLDKYHGKGHSPNYSFRDATIDYVNSKEYSDDSEQGRIRFLNKHFGSTSLTDINNGMFVSILDRTKPRIKPGYYNRIRNQLQSIRKYGLQQVGDGQNITLPKIYQRKVEKKKPVFLTYLEQESLINEFNPILKPLIIFLCYTGARVGEAVSLLWENVDMDKRRIIFWKTKNGDFRSIPMHDRIYESLRGINRERTGPVFLSTKLKPFSYLTNRNTKPLDKTHTNAVKRAFGDRKKFTVHNWRSHWASTHALIGINDKKLMALGGWNDPRSVSAYVNLNPDQLMNDINKMK